MPAKAQAKKARTLNYEPQTAPLVEQALVEKKQAFG
jgi:hypothetical protein